VFGVYVVIKTYTLQGSVFKFHMVYEKKSVIGTEKKIKLQNRQHSVENTTDIMQHF
jgi:hypothetical protein